MVVPVVASFSLSREGNFVLNATIFDTATGKSVSFDVPSAVVKSSF